MNGKKLTLFGVIATASAASAVYGLYRTGLIKTEHFNKLYNEVKEYVDDKFKIISETHATLKPRNRSSKK